MMTGVRVVQRAPCQGWVRHARSLKDGPRAPTPFHAVRREGLAPLAAASRAEPGLVALRSCGDKPLTVAVRTSAVGRSAAGAPSPKAALALVERVGELLDIPVMATDLEIASASYERQVTEVVNDDEEMTEYLQGLEERYDEEDGVPSQASLVEEVERFLRDQRPPGAS